MNTFYLLPNLSKESAQDVTTAIGTLLTSRGATVCCPTRYKGVLPENIFRFCDIQQSDAECVIVIGGDGSVLDAIPTVLSQQLPLIGVNLGHLGFLSEIEPNHLQLLERLLTNDFRVEKRMTLSATRIASDGSRKTLDRYALNEVAVTHGTYFGISDLEFNDPNGCAIRYRSDGIILATPSGSTAYSLSAGGPVVDLSLDAICVTPICPHSLCSRPLLFAADKALTITNRATDDRVLFVSLDGRNACPLHAGDSIEVSAADERVNFIVLTSHSSFETLREKFQTSDRSMERI